MLDHAHQRSIIEMAASDWVHVGGSMSLKYVLRHPTLSAGHFGPYVSACTSG